MKSGTKPLLSLKWWLKNKAKTLSGKEWSASLKAYEQARGKRDVAAVIVVLRKMPAALEKTIKSCNRTLHKETIAALEKYPALIVNETERMKALKRKMDAINKLTPDDVLKSKELRKKYASMMTQSDEVELYLHFQAKKNVGDQETYDKFLKSGKFNLGSKSNNAINEVANSKNPDWSKLDWVQIKTETTSGLFDFSVHKEFKSLLIQELLEAEL